MRKPFLSLAVIAAIATPLAFATSANADVVTGGLNTTTYAAGTTYQHLLTTDYTCGVADGKTVVNFKIIFDGGSGSGVLVPDSANGGTFAFDGVTGSTYDWHYAGMYAPGGAWTTASATANSGSEAYGFGTAGQTVDHFGTVVGSFIGIPTCTTPEVPTAMTGNHGEYVSGAARAGIKGKDLAAIAKNVALVGPYNKG
jgi:hypothetical protein